MTQPQALQKRGFPRPLELPLWAEDLQSYYSTTKDPGIGSQDPEPAPTDTFQPTDIY